MSETKRTAGRNATPLTEQRAHETQAFGAVIHMPLALAEETRRASIDNLNQLLADVLTIRDLYKKHHWQANGPAFYQLHLLFDKHAGEQTELGDSIAERIMTLGGVSIAMAADIAEKAKIPRPPKGREAAPAQLARLLQAHEVILEGPARWPGRPPRWAMTAPTTCSSAASFAPTRCRSGSLPSTSPMARLRAPAVSVEHRR
jgi:DNA-binding ferritin-like protein